MFLMPNHISLCFKWFYKDWTDWQTTHTHTHRLVQLCTHTLRERYAYWHTGSTTHKTMIFIVADVVRLLWYRCGLELSSVYFSAVNALMQLMWGCCKLFLQWFKMALQQSRANGETVLRRWLQALALTNQNLNCCCFGLSTGGDVVTFIYYNIQIALAHLFTFRKPADINSAEQSQCEIISEWQELVSIHSACHNHFFNF